MFMVLRYHGRYVFLSELYAVLMYGCSTPLWIYFNLSCACECVCRWILPSELHHTFEFMVQSSELLNSESYVFFSISQSLSSVAERNRIWWKEEVSWVVPKKIPFPYRLQNRICSSPVEELIVIWRRDVIPSTWVLIAQLRFLQPC